MNTPLEVPMKKVSETIKLASTENIDDGQSGKRSRGNSPEDRYTKPQKRIRETLYEINVNTTTKKLDSLIECSVTNNGHSEETMNKKSCELSTDNCQNNTKIVDDNKMDEKGVDATTILLDSEFDTDFHDFFDEPFDDIDEKAVDLREFRRCKVFDIVRDKGSTKLSVQDTRENSTARVLCSGFWREMPIEINDIVSIKAKKELDYWIVNNDHGFLVTQPDHLISGTTVVGTHFCLRRGVLKEMFAGLDSLPNLKSDDCGMTIGIIIHEVLQKVLRKKLTTIPEIRKVAYEIINSRHGAQMLLDANISLRDCKQQLESYIPKISNFVKCYILGDADQMLDNNFKGKIEHIREIEENIWLPEMGLKGKIDVTVDTTVNLNRKMMPLELKTGRPTFSLEHRGQLILYNMMLRSLGQEVDTGLLLYIKLVMPATDLLTIQAYFWTLAEILYFRENIMQEIKNNHPEERDLILLRNSFANYVTKMPQYDEVRDKNGSVKKVWKSMELPEPINHHVACQKCPYNTVCCIYADKDPNIQLSDSNVLKDVSKGVMNYLKQEHIDYFMRWVTMLRLENSIGHDLAITKNLWMLEPRKREKLGTCVYNLEVCGDVIEEDDQYLHTFVRKNQNKEHSVVDLNCAPFTDSDYIIVSTDTRINISAGYLKRKSKYGLEILLDRDVTRQNAAGTFHLDNYPYSGLSTRNFANVACLLNDNEITEKMRGIVIEKKPATFIEKLPKSVAELMAPLIFRLNTYQRKAILMVLTANDYVLIKGMPGTGKTQTLVSLIEILVKMGLSVLITAHTHSAVDNILLKLNERDVDFLRLGNKGRIHSALQHKSESFITSSCTTPESLEAIYYSKQVVAVTCLGAFHSLIAKRIFDVCLVDESSQVLQPTVLRPIYSAKKFVLVGDPQQLPPVIRNDEARKMGMNESLFARLCNEHNTATLELQYRMNRKIMSVANDLTYNGNLKTASNTVATATLHLPNTMVLESCERWISKTLSLNLEDSIVMLNTGGTYALQTKSECEKNRIQEERRVCNIFEAAIIVRLISVLQKGGVKSNSIGVICPFRAQVELLRNYVREDIEVNTVDQYQGRDKEVIFYSCTRSKSESCEAPQAYEVLEDSERLNVAVTRAKHKLIIVGDKLALNRFTPFEKLFKAIKKDIVDLEPGRDDFSWDDIMPLKK